MPQMPGTPYGLIMPSDAKQVALIAVRNRAKQLAAAILRAERAQAQFAIAFNAAGEAGAEQHEVNLQIRLACQDDPEASAALERLRLLEVLEGEDA